MGKFEYEKWKERYFNNKIIDIFRYLNEEDIEVLRRLKIIIEKKIYTEYEFDIIEQDLIAYYKDENEMTKEELGNVKPLINGVSKEQYNNILEKFDKISYIYKI